jgi:hypothetical protein
VGSGKDRGALMIVAFIQCSGSPHNGAAYSRDAEGAPMRKILVAALVSAFCASAALAQTTPPAAPAPTAKTTPKAKAPAKPRSAESIECSKQADAKGLHGKPRKTFRAKCMKDMKKKS